MYKMNLLSGDSYPILKIEGRIENAEGFERDLQDILDSIELQAGEFIILDIDKVEYICSECINVFINLRNRFPIHIRYSSPFIEWQLKAVKLI